MKTKRFLSLAAIFALAFFFACSNEAEPQPAPSGGEQSGNGEQQQVFCKLNAGTCSQMSLSTCMELVNAGAAQIVSTCTADPEPPQPPSQPSSSSVVPTPTPSSSSVAPPPTPSSSSVVPTPTPSSSSQPNPVTPSSSSIAPSSSSVATSGTFTDSRDSKVYKWVKIGTQTWMGENLNYTPTSGNSKCPDNTSANCTKYGRQYDWATANRFDNSCNTANCVPTIGSGGDICPSGWHLPSDADWTTLVAFVGTNPGTKLKATSGWPSGANGTDNYGFKALPGGYVCYNCSSTSLFDTYPDIGTRGHWWTSTGYDATNAYSYMMGSTADEYTGVYNYGNKNKNYSFIKQNMLSVRCVKY